MAPPVGPATFPQGGVIPQPPMQSMQNGQQQQQQPAPLHYVTSSTHMMH